MHLLANTVIYDCVSVQADLDIIDKWLLKNCMPISINKSFMLHCGNNNPRQNYELQGENLPPVENMIDLRIIKIANSNYSQHIANVVTKASRLSGMVLRAFRHCSVDVL